VLRALLDKSGTLVADELNHASLIDGCRLSRAETFVYRHRDLEHLEYGLNQAGARAALIITDGVFSMDGDVAPLIELTELSRRYGCRLMVDEAHGTGALGPGGRGTVAAAGLEGEVDVIVGTLGKALGGYGAYVCSTAEVIELLVNVSRPFIFSTAPPPPSIGAALAALSLLDARPGLVEQLRRNAAGLRQALTSNGLEIGPSRTQIVPVIVGDARRAVALGERTLDGGIFAQAIRPPTVPEGSSRLRLTVMANHREDELQRAAKVIARAAIGLGVGIAEPYLRAA
jgi:8-amino-7-oxononanoate synthase